MMQPNLSLLRCWTLAACVAASVLTLSASPALAQEASVWSLDEYTRLSTAMSNADEDLALTAPGTDSWREANVAAIDARRAMVSYITAALRSGDMPEEFVEPATQARFVLVQNIISINADLGYCEQANAALVLLREVSDSSDAVREAFEAAQADVTGCTPYSPADAVIVANVDPDPVDPAPGDTEPVTDPEPGDTEPSDTASTVDPMAEPEAAGSGRRTVGIALLATGGAMLVGGLGWDIASAQGPRSEFTELSDTCDGSADCVERLNELSDTIDSSRAPIGALTIGGAAIAVTGTVLWLTAPRERDAQRVSFMPEWRPGYMGASLSFR